MRKHTAEKQELVKRISEQAETIHQLTHHVHLLQSKCEANEVRVQEDLLSNSTASRFGGSYPIFVKESFPLTTTSTPKTRDESSIAKPWPLSDPLEQRYSRSEQETTRNEDHRRGRSILEPDKSFVSRMTEGISHHSSSFLGPAPAASERSHTVSAAAQGLKSSFLHSSDFVTPSNDFQKGRPNVQTEKTLQVSLPIPHLVISPTGSLLSGS